MQGYQQLLGSTRAPGPAQWVKDLVLLQLQLIGSDLIPGQDYALGGQKNYYIKVSFHLRA